MAKYNVQNFTYDGPGDSLCYGQQDVHDHNRAVQFTLDVTAWLVNQNCQNIQPGVFRSSQPKPAAGKEFRWDGNHWIKV